MIDHLDRLLRHLFLTRVPKLTDEAQVRFQPPDQQWRQYIGSLTVNAEPVPALNLYLADLRENRKLRTNERIRDVQNGFVTETPSPQRLDCHYLITAWSPATQGMAVEATADEHVLLYQAIAALMKTQPLVPRAVYSPDPLPAGFPQLIADAELPTVILPAEGYTRLAEFWGTMGELHPLKPAIYLIVTLPVELSTEIAGSMVTTRVTEYRRSGEPGGVETLIQIGGAVTDPSGKPLAGVWVQLEEMGGKPVEQMETKELGRFTFAKLQPGHYRLRVRAEGLGEMTRDIEVPSPSGEYDLRF
jgi:hypothetical protein